MYNNIVVSKKSDQVYEELQEKFTRELLTLDSNSKMVFNSEANNLSRLMHAFYNISSEKENNDLKTAYFLKFVNSYLSGENRRDKMIFFEQLTSVAVQGLITGNVNDVKLFLNEKDLSELNYEKYNWLEILYLETMRLFLLTIRQKGNFSDIDHIYQKIDELTQMQKEKEEMLLDEQVMSTDEIAQLIVLYNTITALKDSNNYLEKGFPTTIEVKLERYSDNIKEVFNKKMDARFYYAINNIMIGLNLIIKNSVWKQLKTGAPIDKFVEEMVSRGNKNAIFQLLPSQIEAFEKGIDSQRNSAIIIQMHTSAGKSLLAQYLIAQNLQYDSNSQIAYVVPTRALVHQSLYDLRNTFKNMDYNIEATIPAYEIDKVEEKLLDEKIDILVTTPEKLNLLVRSNHQAVKRLSFVVVDEAHNISDKNRGLSLEFLLATLKRKKEFIRTVLLTPFIKDDNNRKLVAEWLGGNRGLPVYSKWKPTRQLISVLKRYKPTNSRYYEFELETLKPEQVDFKAEYSKLREKIKFDTTTKPNNYKTMATAVAKRFINKGAVLILAESPHRAEGQALDLAESISESKALSEDLKLLIKFIKEELGETHSLINCLKKRVAFHHSGLSEEIKILIEKLIIKGDINYIVGTTTLAQGMNFPISTVIFRTIYFPRKNKAPEEMEAEVFWNIAGRAGRVFKDYAGRVIFLADGKEREIEIKKFIRKQGEGINSAIFETIKNLDDFSIKFNRKLVVDNQAISQLLQFISGTLNMLNEEEIDENPENLIDEILRLSFAYKQLSRKGEIQRKKLLNIAKKYIAYLKGKQNWKGIASLVDQTGFSSMTVDYLLARKSELPDFKNTNLQDIISNQRKMTDLVDILSGVPEISLGVGGDGAFSPELVAKVTNAWVNGWSLNKIYNLLLGDIHNDIRKSVKYIYQTITGRLSWGMGAMQSIALSNDEENSDVLNLPSLIYYGVPNEVGVAFRMAGVPRSLAVKISEQIDESDLSIERDKISGTRKWLKNLNIKDWNNYSSDTNLSGSEWKRIWELIEG